MYKIPLFDLEFDDAEADAVAQTVRSGWISMGEKVRTLEAQMASRLGGGDVIAVSSGTAALHMALAAAGLGPGDEVLVPSLTFVATANAVRYVGATPVFVDVIGPGEPTIDPADARRKLTARTKAILPVHYAGFPCRMEEIASLAKEHHLTVVEDAAHTIDVEYRGKKLGTWGDYGCFSLFSNKVITCGEGGLVTCRDAERAAECRLLRSHGMTTLSYDRAKGHATTYDVVSLGFNYRMDDIHASVALAQLDKLDGILARRRELRATYENLLGQVRGIQIPFRDSQDPSANYIFPIVLSADEAISRDLLREALKDQGIQTSLHYPPIHRFRIYDAGESLPQTERYCDQTLTLPLFGGLTESQLCEIRDAIKAALGQ